MSVTITEYQNVARSAQGDAVLAGQEPSLAVQVLELGETSEPFNGLTTFIHVDTDMGCRYQVGRPRPGPRSRVSTEAYLGVLAGLTITVWGDE